jgi:hypothetical protein
MRLSNNQGGEVRQNDIVAQTNITARKLEQATSPKSPRSGADKKAEKCNRVFFGAEMHIRSVFSGVKILVVVLPIHIGMRN